MLNIKLIGNYTQSFPQIPQRLHDALLKKITILTLKLQRYVKDEKLSGQVLKHRTGQLWQSIQSDVTDSPDKIQGRVFSAGNIKYAAIHEFGFDGMENVKAHNRTISQAFGRAIPLTVVNVKEHVRHMVMPERSFLRSSLTDMKEEIIKGLQDAAKEGLAT